MLDQTPPRAPLPAESFVVLPADHLGLSTTAPVAVSLPVIDMSRGRDEVRRAILDAGKEMGFFQLVNHGVPEQVLQDMEAVCAEFFQLPAADKAAFYSEDKTKPNRLLSGTTYETLGERYCRDCLRLVYPLPVAVDNTKDWPDKPRRLREVVEKFTVLTRGLAMEILRLLCEGMGLRTDFFEGDISGGRVSLDINHYPACPKPNPSMATTTLGLPPHCDRDLITILLPGKVPGLEVAYKGDWIKVHPAANSFVVNFGLQLEVVTNGMLKSIEHRAVTNSAVPRMSVATFVVPADDCVIGPAEEFVSDDNPPCYRTLKMSDFKRTHNVVNLGSSINLITNLRNNQKGKIDENPLARIPSSTPRAK